MTDLEKTLSRASITLACKLLAHTPSQGLPPGTRMWRATLSRKIRGEEKPLRLTLVLLSDVEPTMTYVIKGLHQDIEASELSTWDFGQAFNNGKTNELAETMRKACKRLAPRVRRFFGDLWTKLEKNGISHAA